MNYTPHLTNKRQLEARYWTSVYREDCDYFVNKMSCWKKYRSCNANFSHAGSRSDFTRILVLHKNIYATHVVTLSAGGVDTISKNNLNRITLLPFILSWCCRMAYQEISHERLELSACTRAFSCVCIVTSGIFTVWMSRGNWITISSYAW